MSNFFKTKSIKPVSTSMTFTLDFTRLIAPATIVSITSVASSLTITGSAIVNVQVSNILPNMSLTFTTSGGVTNTEYLVTVTIVDSNGNTWVAYNVVLVTNLVNCNYYGNTFTDYFALNLNNETWNAATSIQKISALIQATRAIDRLNFVGHKLTQSQVLQFPRNTNSYYLPFPFDANNGLYTFPTECDYPDDIEFACYEEASLLLADPDTQDAISSTNIIAEQLGAAKVSYDRSYIQTNVRSGIMSVMAWNFLQPYIRDNLEINLERRT